MYEILARKKNLGSSWQQNLPAIKLCRPHDGFASEALSSDALDDIGNRPRDPSPKGSMPEEVQ